MERGFSSEGAAMTGTMSLGAWSGRLAHHHKTRPPLRRLSTGQCLIPMGENPPAQPPATAKSRQCLNVGASSDGPDSRARGSETSSSRGKLSATGGCGFECLCPKGGQKKRYSTYYKGPGGATAIVPTTAWMQKTIICTFLCVALACFSMLSSSIQMLSVPIEPVVPSSVLFAPEMLVGVAGLALAVLVVRWGYKRMLTLSLAGQMFGSLTFAAGIVFLPVTSPPALRFGMLITGSYLWTFFTMGAMTCYTTALTLFSTADTLGFWMAQTIYPLSFYDIAGRVLELSMFLARPQFFVSPNILDADTSEVPPYSLRQSISSLTPTRLLLLHQHHHPSPASASGLPLPLPLPLQQRQEQGLVTSTHNAHSSNLLVTAVVDLLPSSIGVAGAGTPDFDILSEKEAFDIVILNLVIGVLSINGAAAVLCSLLTASPHRVVKPDGSTMFDPESLTGRSSPPARVHSAPVNNEGPGDRVANAVSAIAPEKSITTTKGWWADILECYRQVLRLRMLSIGMLMFGFGIVNYYCIVAVVDSVFIMPATSIVATVYWIMQILGGIFMGRLLGSRRHSLRNNGLFGFLAIYLLLNITFALCAYLTYTYQGSGWDTTLPVPRKAGLHNIDIATVPIIIVFLFGLGLGMLRTLSYWTVASARYARTGDFIHVLPYGEWCRVLGDSLGFYIFHYIGSLRINFWLTWGLVLFLFPVALTTILSLDDTPLGIYVEIGGVLMIVDPVRGTWRRSDDAYL